MSRGVRKDVHKEMEFGRLDTLLQSITIASMTKEQLQQARKDLESVSADVKSRLKKASALRKEAMQKRKQLVDQEKKDARAKRLHDRAVAKQFKSFKHAELCSHMGVKSAIVLNSKSKLPQVGKWKLAVTDPNAGSFTLTRQFERETGKELALPKNAKAAAASQSMTGDDVCDVSVGFTRCTGSTQLRLAGLVFNNLNDFYKKGNCVFDEEGKTNFHGSVMVEEGLRPRLVLLAKDVEYPPTVQDRVQYRNQILGDRSLFIFERFGKEITQFAKKGLARSLLSALMELKDFTTQPIFGSEYICKLNLPVEDYEE